MTQQNTRITNVRVFDGVALSEPETIVIEKDKIGLIESENDHVIDGQGGALLPGFIDAHVHLNHPDHLHKLAAAGVTTALDMGAWPKTIASLRKLKGLPDIRSAGSVMTAPGAFHSTFDGLPDDTIVKNASEAEAFVRKRILEKSDYIKLIADIPGPSQESLNAAVVESRKLGMMTIAHAVQYEAFSMALKAGVNVITHVPMDRPVSKDDALRMAKSGCVCVPTLTTLRSSTNPKHDYANARQSVTTMHEAGVTILAGTDAVDYPGAPSSAEHGSSFATELELLVDAGMTTVEALNSATIHTALHFDLVDRSCVSEGERADLVLLDGDPTQDISAARRVQKVWCAGVLYQDN